MNKWSVPLSMKFSIHIGDLVHRGWSCTPFKGEVHAKDTLIPKQGDVLARNKNV